MRRTFFSAVLACAFLAQTAPALGAFAPLQTMFTVAFDSPIDAFSVRMQGTEFRYSFQLDHEWSEWQTYEDDGDNGPGEESELIMVPPGVTALRIAGIASASALHPMRVSKGPVRVRVAAAGEQSGMPTMLTRAEWGADDTYLLRQPAAGDQATESDVSKGDSGGETTTPAQRVKDCQEAQNNDPDGFGIASTVTEDAQGKTYLWPLQYSNTVRLLVVHHSALIVQGDPRPPVERVRALYKYHARSRGWGDIGYHFIVDENGQVYEGRQGGKSVVGAHAYCNNTGTIGIVLLGNFELEVPSQAQARGLQHLLDSLARQYDLDVHRSIQFHGRTFDTPIVAHRDLLPTLCPGFSLFGALPQVVANVQTGKLDDPVTFTPPNILSSSASSVTPPGLSGLAEGISFIGRTSISINPGGKQRLSFTYTAPRSGAYEGKKIADVRLSAATIKLWQYDGIHQIPITKGILLGSDVPAGESTSLQLIVQAPILSGSYSMDIAGLHFTLSVAGRRARTGDFINPFGAHPALIVQPTVGKPSRLITSRVRPQSRRSSSPNPNPNPNPPPQQIRVRLSASASPSITFTDTGSINGKAVSPGTSMTLRARGSQCQALAGDFPMTEDSLLRLQSTGSSGLTVDAVRSKIGVYKGTLECRVLDGNLVLINELSLEDYMAGLSEEPDTDTSPSPPNPYEKQRAFAIAARTYALFYLQPGERKFPGKPYDASDDPAVFQSYSGMNFTVHNPQWIRAVESTRNKVLRYTDRLIKPPYFSSDDGRTRSPAEAGWKNFPFADIFLSKPDPWCAGMTLRGHGVGMSGCGAKAQALEGRSAEQILQYYYPGVRIVDRNL